jgi:hypothetical protein
MDAKREAGLWDKTIRKLAKYWELGLDHEIGQAALSWLGQSRGRLELARAKRLLTVNSILHMLLGAWDKCPRQKRAAHVAGNMGQVSKAEAGGYRQLQPGSFRFQCAGRFWQCQHSPRAVGGVNCKIMGWPHDLMYLVATFFIV